MIRVLFVWFYCVTRILILIDIIISDKSAHIAPTEEFESSLIDIQFKHTSRQPNVGWVSISVYIPNICIQKIF